MLHRSIINERIAPHLLPEILRVLLQSRIARKFTGTVWGRVFLVFWIGKTVAFYLFVLVRILLLSVILMLISNINAFAQESDRLETAR